MKKQRSTSNMPSPNTGNGVDAAMAMELPEAVTLARQMDGSVRGKQIVHADLRDCDALIRQTFVNMHRFDVTGRTITAVTTKGKWICIRLDSDLWLLTALETAGRILYHTDQDDAPVKYNLKLTFSDHTYLTIAIVGWGFLHVVRDADRGSHFFTGRVGISPLGDLSYPIFAQFLTDAPGMTAKEFFLDQTRIAGIGNGYLQEILFRAKVHPARKVRDLRDEERLALYRWTCAIMSEATARGGSEVDLFGQPGGYQKLLGLHMLGQPCPQCGTPIARIKLRGSSCYICPSCQV